MRILLTFIILLLFDSLNAQSTFPVLQNNIYSGSLYHDHHLYDTAQKKWFVSRYFGISAGYSFFKEGSAGVISAPVSVQLNHRLNNNLYTFAGVSVAPAFINFSSTFLNAGAFKTNAGNNFYKHDYTSAYQGAALGLMYINDAKTFSISGSISIEKNNYPVYNYNPANTTKPNNNPAAYR